MSSERVTVEYRGCDTVAIISDPAGAELGFGIARWNPEDRYDRQLGRTIAVGRARKDAARRRAARASAGLLDRVVLSDEQVRGSLALDEVLECSRCDRPASLTAAVTGADWQARVSACDDHLGDAVAQVVAAGSIGAGEQAWVVVERLVVKESA